MLEKINYIHEEILTRLEEAKKDAEEFRLEFLSKKGKIPQLFDDFKSLPSEQKREFGKQLNELKQFAARKFEELKERSSDSGTSDDEPDLTRPGIQLPLGSRHPVSLYEGRSSIFSQG